MSSTSSPARSDLDVIATAAEAVSAASTASTASTTPDPVKAVADACTQTDFPRPMPTQIVIPGRPTALVLTNSSQFSTDLYRLAVARSPALGKRTQDLAMNSQLTQHEKLALIRMHASDVLKSLVVSSSSSSSSPAAAPSNPPSNPTSNPTSNPCTISVDSTATTPLTPHAQPDAQPFTGRAKCSKKEGRCVGHYCVLANGKFHGSHDNTGCSGVPLIPDAKRRRRIFHG